MPGKTLIEVRDLAKQMAERRGHKIRRWNRKRFHYTAICEKCRARIRAYSYADEEPGRAEVLNEKGNILVIRSSDRYWTERDFNLADGAALRDDCSVRSSPDHPLMRSKAPR